jgi:hypothetical protein
VQVGICERNLEFGVLGEQHVNSLYRLRHVPPPAPFCADLSGSASAIYSQTRTDARPVHVHAQFGRR